jgi:hypothetical protein
MNLMEMYLPLVDLTPHCIDAVAIPVDMNSSSEPARVMQRGGYLSAFAQEFELEESHKV